MRGWAGGLQPRALQWLIAVAAGIALTTGLLARRGSWLGDDLDLLVDGEDGFSPGSLLAPADGHVVPGLRFVFALLAHLPFDYDVSVAWRVVVQLCGLVLMGLLLHRLTGSAGWAVAGTALYGLNPLGVPAYMELSAAVSDLHAQALAVVFLHATLDWVDGRRRRSLVLVAASLLLYLSFSPRAGVVVTTAVALLWVVGRSRGCSWRRDLLPWAGAVAVPVGVHVALAASQRPVGSGRQPGTGPVPARVLDGVLRTAVQPFAGGPWSWSPTPPLGLATPGPVAVTVGVLVVAALVGLAAWRARAALAVWASAAVIVVATVVTVAAARQTGADDLLTRTYHQWSDLGLPIVLATVLTLQTALTHPAGGTTSTSASRHRWWRPGLAVAGVVWAASAVVSHVTFAQQWDDNPARAWFATVRAEVGRYPTPPNVWNTTLPADVSGPLQQHRRIGEVLAMAGYDVRVQQPDSAPLLVGDDGRLQFAELAGGASAPVPGGCHVRLRGRTSLTLPLSRRLPPDHWYVTLAYLANPDARVQVRLVDSVTGTSHVLDDHHQPWPSGLLTVYLDDAASPTPVRADRLVLTSTDPTTELCLGATEVGLVRQAG